MSNVPALFQTRREPQPPPSLPGRVRLFSRVLSLGLLVLAILFATVVVSAIGAMFLIPDGMLGLGPDGGWFDTSGHMAGGNLLHEPAGRCGTSTNVCC